MLGKLLKYEIKATARTFLPLYLVLIVFAFINNLVSLLFREDYWGLPAVISLSLYIIILVGMFVITYVVMIRRFYKNLLKDEGYLMFTLPIGPWMHIICKLIVSMMWMFLSTITAGASITIIALKEISLSEIIEGIVYLWSETYQLLGTSIYLFLFEMLIGTLVSMVSGILIIYASMALGHLSNNHKVLASIGAFLAINTVTQTMSTLLFSAVFSSIFRFDKPLPFIPTESVMHVFIWFGIGISVVFSAGYFIITNTILCKKLNLE